MNKNAFGLALVDLSALARNVSPKGRSESTPQVQLLEQTLHAVKRIVSSYRPRNMLIYCEPGALTSLFGGEEAYRGIVGAMGVQHAFVTRKDSYGLCSKLIATSEGSGRPVVLVTDDSLMGPLLSQDDDVHIEMLPDHDLYTRATFVAQHGFDPKLMKDFHALCGHEDLHIAGVPYVGPRTAMSWLTRFGKDYASEVQALDGVKVAKAFMSPQGQKAFSSALSRVNECLSPYQGTVPGVLRHKVNREALFAQYQKHGLYGLMPKAERQEYSSVTTRADFLFCLSRIRGGTVSLYFESDKKTREIVGIGVSDGQSSFGIPLARCEDMDATWIGAQLSQYCSRGDVAVVANSGKSYYKALGGSAPALSSDLEVLAYSVDTMTSRKDFSELCKTLAPSHDISETAYGIVVANGSDQAASYLSQRAFVTLLSNRRLYEASRSGAYQYYLEQEAPFTRLLFQMESKGVSVDYSHLRHLQESYLQRSQEILASINGKLPDDHKVSTLNRPAIEHLLYDVFKLTPPRLSPSGGRSVDDESLSQLSGLHWAPGMIQEYQKLETLVSKSIAPILRHEATNPSLVFPSLNQCVTVTGRLSVTDPALQGIPSKTPDGRAIRSAFVSKDGYSMVSADYSQMELRVLAHLSQDPVLLDAFRNGLDPHAITGAKIFDVDVKEVTSDMRRVGKTINFGIIYGLTDFGLAGRLGITTDRAKEFKSKYFQEFKGVRAYLESTSEKALREGYVTTIGGRKISLQEEGESTTYSDNARRQRRAYNYPMQGGAAEIVKQAMLQSHDLIMRDFPKASILFQVHDELVFEVPEGQAREFVSAVSSVMERSPLIDVPLTVDVGVGQNWEECHRMDSKLEMKDSEPSMSM